jgi:hypothetical protein
MLLIGLGYKARQGKNTAAMAMLNAAPIDLDIRMVAFADSLRSEVNTAIRQAHGAENLIEGFQEAGIMPAWVRPEVFPDKQRTLLQWWGTEYRRAQDENYWVKRLFQRLKVLDPDVAIITDLRYPNEAEAIKRAGGVLVRVSRTTPPDVEVNPHPSETALDGYTGWDAELSAENVTALKSQAAALFHFVSERHKCSISI